MSNRPIFFFGDTLEEAIENLLERISWIEKEGRVSRGVAQDYIRCSACWYSGHPAGLVRAEKHADRIKGSDDSWYVIFGSNKFYASEAISRCTRRIRLFLDLVASGRNPTTKDVPKLKIDLTRDLSESVGHVNGHRYDSYPVNDGHMIFGTQSINTKDFIEKIFSSVPVDRFIAAFPEGYERKNNQKRTSKTVSSGVEPILRKAPSAISHQYRLVKGSDSKVKDTETSLRASIQGNKTERGTLVPARDTKKDEAKRALNKTAKKLYRQVLEAEELGDKVGNAILVLESVDASLNGTVVGRRPIFSAFSSEALKNGSSLKKVRKLLFSLFEERDFSLSGTGEKGVRIGTEMVVQTLDTLLRMAGYDPPRT